MRSAVPKQRTRALRVAIVGAGAMGYWHSRAARRLGSQVVAVVDPDAKRATALARACRVAAVATEMPALDATDLDAVHICSPASTHFMLVSKALEAGLHVLVEKPLAGSAAETERLLMLAQQQHLVLCPVHQIAFQVGVRDAGRAAGAELDNLCAIDFRICSAGGAGRSPAEMDEIIADILPHPFSVLRKLWPQASWEPHRWFVTRPRSGELLVAGNHAGALLSLFVSMHARPTCFEMTVYSRHGVIALDFFHGFAIRYNGDVSRLSKILRPFATSLKLFGIASINLIGRGLSGEIAYPGLQQLTRQFYDAVRGIAPSPIAPDDVMAVAIARDAVLAGGNVVVRGRSVT